MPPRIVETMAELDRMYLRAHQAIVALLAPSVDASTPVPATPGWDVHAVVAHLGAVAEDILEGRLRSVPSDEETAAQVARARDRSLAELLERWAASVPGIQALLAERQIWPLVLDALSHEQDLRGALGQPGRRDDPDLLVAAESLLRNLSPGSDLTICTEGPTFTFGDHPETLILTTTRYEAFRWRLGRRSAAQLAAMDWSGDPSPVLDSLCTFGPRSTDLVE